MKKTIIFITYLYLILLIILALMPFWPQRLWWVANIVQLGPLLLLAIPLILLLIPSLILHLWKSILIQVLCVFLIFFGIMRFQCNLIRSDSFTSMKDDRVIRILSMNTGKDWEVALPFNRTKFVKFLKQTKPDIIALQESGNKGLLKTIQNVFPNEIWYSSFHGEFSLISKMPIADQEIQWKGRNAARKYQIKAKDYTFDYFNVHFTTPRFGIIPLRKKGLSGIKEMKKITDAQEAEAQKTAEIIRASSNVIISGDFNMTTLHPIFRVYWSKFQNAFSKRGFGFGHSKDFPFHGIKGVRIDHVLCDSNWQVINAKIGPSMDCDHHPVVVDLRYMGENEEPLKEEIAQQEPEHRYSDIKLIDFSNAYHYEEFEQSLGSFKANKTCDLMIDSDTKYLRGNALKIKKKPNAGKLKCGITFNLWDFENYATLSFSYKIPDNVPACVKVKTRFGDWITLAGSKRSQCEGAIAKDFIPLLADNQWHEVDINVKEAVKSLLLAVKYLEELQFAIDHPLPENNVFWIDDLRISGDTHRNPN